jgi:uncharacterized protein YndB with AHSA1/START domain
VVDSCVSLWWPKGYQNRRTAMQSAVIEPKANGRWYEVGADGAECLWGRVLAWEPPQRLVLAWQITAAWKFDADFSTEVEVRFVAQGPKRTLVELEHRHLERYGEAAARTRETMDGGWPGILARYRDAVAVPA